MSQSAIDRFQRFRLLCDAVGRHEPKRLDRSRPVLIFGAGQFGQAVCSALRAEGFEVQGFIETKPAQREVLSLPVLSWKQLTPDQTRAQLAIGIFNRQAPMNDLSALGRSAGFSDIFLPWDFYAQLGHRLGWRFWLSTPNVILESLPTIERIYQNLADDDSRECFLRILAFRLGQDLDHGGFRSAENQYFNELTLPALAGKHVSYVDGGAYNGDTFLELADHAVVASAWLFEPDIQNYDQLVNAVKDADTQTVCLPLALTDRYQILSFSSGQGEGSAISAQGTVHIAAGALDQILAGQHIDFVKLDIEGAEIQALQGSVETITRSRPVLAISLYHRPEDLWEIPALLLSYCRDYRFHMRQHCYNSFDTVMYAIPNHQ